MHDAPSDMWIAVQLIQPCQEQFTCRRISHSSDPHHMSTHILFTARYGHNAHCNLVSRCAQSDGLLWQVFSTGSTQFAHADIVPLSLARRILATMSCRLTVCRKSLRHSRLSMKFCSCASPSIGVPKVMHSTLACFVDKVESSCCLRASTNHLFGVCSKLKR